MTQTLEGSKSVDGTSRRPTFTITEASTACAVSRKTITRKLTDLAANGAAKDDDGIWRIPVEALLAVGLHPGRSVAPEPVVDLRQPEAPKPTPVAEIAETITIPRDRWDDLRIRLARAEAEASERGKALDDARLALRALTAGPSATAVPPLEVATAPGYGPHLPVGAPTPDSSVMTASNSVWDTLFGQPPAAPRQGDQPTPPAMELPEVVPPMAPVSMPAEPVRRRWWDFLVK